ncbi:hypothetical protein MRX96_004576 [Rhipicephalus microplus]
MTDQPADPSDDFWGTTVERSTRTATNAYNAPGQPEYQLRAHATTATQAVNYEHATCARAARPRTIERIPLTLVQDPVLLQSRHCPCAPSSLTVSKMHARRLQIRRHPTTDSHVSRVCLKDGDVIVARVKHRGSFLSALPKYSRMRALPARRRKYGDDTP